MTSHFLPPAHRSDIVRPIVDATAEVYRVSPADIMGRSRQHKFAAPRLVAVYLARERAGLKLSAIAAAFERDHTTIINACRGVAGAIKAHPQLAGVVENIWEKANGR